MRVESLEPEEGAEKREMSSKKVYVCLCRGGVAL